MLTLEQVEPAAAPPIESFSDCTVFQTDEWLNFVEETQGAQRVVAVVCDGNTVVGRFTGLIVKRLGVRLLGSPSPGWTTAYMGFNLQPGVSRVEALTALSRFAFKDLGCIHYEAMDRRITAEQADELGSSRRHLKVPHRNESLLWYAMRHWKAKRMTVFDMGGGGEYKRRYGGEAIVVPWIRKSRYPGLEFIREGMRRYGAFRQRRGADPTSPPK